MMTRLVHLLVLAAVLLAVFSSASAAPPTGWTVRAGAETIAAQGGWQPERWLKSARLFADTLLREAPDRYGPRHTPLWLGVINPSTGGLLRQKPPNWQSYWDAEDYIMMAQGCNVYRDLPTLTAFHQLSRDTRDPRYARGVDALLRHWMREYPSKTTGLFPWGEHMSVNLVRDKLIASRHEMEQNLPDWEMLWRLNPEAVRREIEAIWRISVWDKQGFVYDRHANYHTGQFDALPVRGAYIKHSGLFAYSFLFLYTKTHDPQHLAWARGLADLYWRHRDPRTGLLPGYVGEHGGGGDSFAQMMLAWYLLEAAKLRPDPDILQRGLGITDSMLKHGFDRKTGDFASQLNIESGKWVGAPAAPWVFGGSTSFYPVLACLDAYELSKQCRYLDTALDACERAATTPLPANASPEAVGTWLDVYTRAYRLTHDARWLRYARALADWSVRYLVRNGLVIESPTGYVYHNYTRPGQVLAGWLSLYETERARPLRWTAPPSVSPSARTIPVVAASRAGRLELRWRLPDGRAGTSLARTRQGVARFAVLVPRSATQGLLRFAFALPGGSVLDTGSLPLARNASGLRIGPWELPRWVRPDRPLRGSVRVTDPSGVVRVAARYGIPGGRTGQVPCRTAAGRPGWYAFTVPAAGARASGALSITVLAEGNPGWIVRRESEPQAVALASVARLAGGGEIVRVPALPVTSRTGLPAGLVPGFRVVTCTAPGGARSRPLRVSLTDEELRPLLPGTVAAYRWGVTAWQRVAGSRLDTTARIVTIPAVAGGTFAIGGEPRALWRRTFAGALLSSPAAARLKPGGPLSIVLDTGVPDGALFGLDALGRTRWTRDLGEDQPFTAVADLDGDGADEVVTGGPELAVLRHDGRVLWRVALQGVQAPAVGDLDGDGRLEVVASTDTGTVAAYSAKGRALWRVETGRPLMTAALADLDGNGRLSAILVGKGAVTAMGFDGRKLWETDLPAVAFGPPAVGDIDGDGTAETVCISRTDSEGFLTVLDARGVVRWTKAITREADWCPVIADMDELGRPQILAQLADGTQLGIFNADGTLARTITIESRICQTPDPVDLDGDGRLDLLFACNESCRIWAHANDGRVLWSHTPRSITRPGAKMKGYGSLLVADLDGDRRLEVVGGDDETWLNAIRTETRCPRYAVVNGQFHGDSRHTGWYVRRP